LHDNAALERFEAIDLVIVDGDVVITDAPALTQVRLPNLARIGGRLEIRGAPQLRRCLLDDVTGVVAGEVIIDGVDEVTPCD